MNSLEDLNNKEKGAEDELFYSIKPNFGDLAYHVEDGY